MRKILIAIVFVALTISPVFAAVGVKVNSKMAGTATDLNFPANTTTANDGSTFTIVVPAGPIAEITSGTINGTTLINQTLKGTGTSTGISLRMKDSSSVDRMVILDNGNVGIGTTAPGTSLECLGVINATAYKYPVELFTTGDTLTAAETGKRCIFYLDDADGIGDFVLPAKAVNLEYTFTAGHTSYIRVDTNGTDQIMYSTCTGGDRIYSAGASADSVTVISDGTRWYVTQMKGNWTDAN